MSDAGFGHCCDMYFKGVADKDAPNDFEVKTVVVKDDCGESSTSRI